MKSRQKTNGTDSIIDELVHGDDALADLVMDDPSQRAAYEYIKKDLAKRLRVLHQHLSPEEWRAVVMAQQAILDEWRARILAILKEEQLLNEHDKKPE